MSADHFPECLASEDRAWNWLSDCICESLQACEQRVLQTTGSASAAWAKGYEAGMIRAANEVAAYADERLLHLKVPNRSEDIYAALIVASERVMSLRYEQL